MISFENSPDPRPDDREAIKKEIVEGKKNLERGLKYYEGFFAINIKDFEGKKILDVGSGKGTFVKEARGKDVDAYGLDPLSQELDEEEKEDFLKTGWAEEISSVFEEESFDAIFNLYSAFSYVNDVERLKKIFEEELKALKKGGTIFAYPALHMHGTEDGFLLETKDLYDDDRGDQIGEKFWNFLKMLREERKIYFFLIKPKANEDSPKRVKIDAESDIARALVIKKL